MENTECAVSFPLRPRSSYGVQCLHSMCHWELGACARRKLESMVEVLATIAEDFVLEWRLKHYDFLYSYRDQWHDL